jgi:TetR/AcrR family transcriptional repressor of nem operon
LRYALSRDATVPRAKQFDTDEVLTRAMETFWARGYEATTMQDLVECTGVNRASLYATYGDKHALFLAALHLYDARMRADPLARLERQGRPRRAIRQLFESFAAQVTPAGPNRGCFLTNTALELAARDGEVARIVARSQSGIEAFFARMVKKGKAAGEIPAHVKPTNAARGLLAALIGLVVLSRSRPEPMLLASVVDDALRRLD